MDFNTAISQILILFVIMFIGAAAKKSKIINDSIQDSISVLLMQIALPALILSSSNITRTDEVLPNMINILMVTIISYILTILFCILTAKSLRFDKKTASVFISLIVFGNVGFMGFPVARAFFAEAGVFYATTANLVFTAFLWTYGILLFNKQGKIDFKKLLNLGSISTLITLFMFAFQLKFPYFLQTAFDLIGKMTTPLSMLLIGTLIAEIDAVNLVSNKKVYLVSVIKLVLLPLATAYILKFMGFNAMVISLFASVGVFITTLLSILTLPLTVYILTNFVL